MCRLYAHFATERISAANELVGAGHSLAAQSCCDRRGEKHCDGWGIGYYDHEQTPTIVRRAAAAAEDATFRELAKTLLAKVVFAHVRQASVGDLCDANAHPFACGHWMFAHNGTVTGFDRVGPRLRTLTDPDLLAQIQGTTDSELVFHWLLSQLRRHGPNEPGAAGRLSVVRDVVATSVRQLADWCASEPSEDPAKFNFLFTDGTLLVATRWKHALNVLERNTAEARAVAIASEPATDEAWREIPDGSVVTIDDALTVNIEAI